MMNINDINDYSVGIQETRIYPNILSKLNQKGLKKYAKSLNGNLLASGMNDTMNNLGRCTDSRRMAFGNYKEQMTGR